MATESDVVHLAIGEVGFDLPRQGIDELMRAAASAREHGEWLEFRDARGRYLRVLIPTQLLLVIREHDDADAGATAPDPNDWAEFDYDG